MWSAPKLDWKSTDYYNYDDLNRVENNTEVAAELVRYFIYLPQMNFIKNRDMSHIDFADSLNRIEGYQDLLRQRYTPSGWLQNKMDWIANDKFSFADAYRLENNASLLYLYYKGNSEIIPRCGDVFCGEGEI